MKRVLLSLALSIVFSLFAFSQEVDLQEFVDSQLEKLEFDEGKLVHVPNTGVKIMPPPHFEPDNSIKGFVHPGSASTIQIMEVPGVSYHRIDKSMTKEHIQSQNYTFIDRKELTLNTGQAAVVYLVQFEIDGIIYERMMLFTGETNTIWINFNYPMSMKKLLAPAVEASLLSVQAL